MFYAFLTVDGIVMKAWDKIFKGLDPYFNHISPKNGVVYPTFPEEGTTT